MKRTVAQAFKVIDNQCLIVDGHGYFLGKNHDRIIIKHKNNIVSQIPFEDITCVIISSRSTVLST
jgi:CRISPR/Cas system-associated endonuclease Cas1